jgi:ubiquinone/menaquinone biosynthesis C-methylase UbiE
LIDNESVTERQRKEAQYHDQNIINGVQCNRRTSRSTYYQFFEDLIGLVNDFKVLDLGCGDGWFSIDLMMRGGHVWGVDISHELLKLARDKAAQQGISRRLHFAKMAAEDLAFRSDFFNIVVGSAILHHTNIELTIQSIHRVLAAGGRAVFIEPMNENLLLKIWRRLTPWRRSPLERALESRDLVFIKKSFPKSECRYFGLTSIISEGLMLLFPRSESLVLIDSLLSRVDDFFLKKFPSIGKYCAVVVLDLRK